jgi:hypothetical protein
MGQVPANHGEQKGKEEEPRLPVYILVAHLEGKKPSNLAPGNWLTMIHLTKSKCCLCSSSLP